jgi:hypothetical protein
MAAKLTRLTHKIAIQLHLVSESLPFAVPAPGGQFGSFWIHPHKDIKVTILSIVVYGYETMTVRKQISEDLRDRK